MNSLQVINKYIEESERRGLQGMEKPLLFYFVGLPASGKTTLAHRLEIHLPAMRIATDEIKSLLYRGTEYNLKEVFSAQHKILRALGQKRIHLISDANSGKRSHRTELDEIAREAGYETRAIYCKVPFDILLQRMAQREGEGFYSTQGQMEYYLRELEEPSDAICLQTHLLSETQALENILEAITV